MGRSDGKSGKIEWFESVDGGKETEATEIPGSVPMEWTDEKHNSYLNSIEASFVDQLYNQDFNTNHLLGWASRLQKDADSSRPHTGNSYSGQFKVLRGGCWSEVKFERSSTAADNHTSALARNPWIQHYSSNSLDNGFHSLAEQTGNCGESMSSRHFPSYSSRQCNEDSQRSSTEVSDQNFVDDLEEDTQQSGAHKKRNRTGKHHMALHGKHLRDNSSSHKESISSDSSCTKVARTGWESRRH